MIIKTATAELIRIPLKRPFVTGFGKIENKDLVIVKLKGEEITGLGEASTIYAPIYNHEDYKSVFYVIKKFLIPAVINKEFNSPEELIKELNFIRGNNIAKTGVETAIIDFYCRNKEISVKKFLGTKKDYVKVGISVGMENNYEKLKKKVNDAVNRGYERIKIKISPGKDYEILKKIRKDFGDIPLMCDANSSYDFSMIDNLTKLDEFDLLMIEQPLRENDLYYHSILQKKMDTPICLDESIECFDDTMAAIKLGACKIINIKPGRVGGLLASKEINKLCAKNKIKTWCGGMLETGIGSNHNLCVAGLNNFDYPSDIFPSDQFLVEDIVTPELELKEGSQLIINNNPGIGCELKKGYEKFIVEKKNF